MELHNASTTFQNTFAEFNDGTITTSVLTPVEPPMTAESDVPVRSGYYRMHGHQRKWKKPKNRCPKGDVFEQYGFFGRKKELRKVYLQTRPWQEDHLLQVTSQELITIINYGRRITYYEVEWESEKGKPDSSWESWKRLHKCAEAKHLYRIGNRF
ncbi:hypothetical protein SAICODRAFT_31178 [Saitoella complicata NRRL Y-17804]|uniref:uncharacterized protein n=1 Tax=Saitoella complicata (strain BCRC 22490 / CBS 7301 / JCM 7358 / NBRC 10748 / NRRL Y-17804) TaxID=698492 RepID=UPI0008680320|nr:uncharacterized protein SAICODRAFT_31178 [Saitoella complicata NRRL Y-17804]ODQ51499.1 hypothetical protein SAICODRAFT_31178 [Saitoella complicata NRRL Y-17804]